MNMNQTKGLRNELQEIRDIEASFLAQASAERERLTEQYVDESYEWEGIF